MNLYWLVELNGSGSAVRTLAVVAEDGERRTFRLLVPPSAAPARHPHEEAKVAAAVPVDVDVVVSWAGHRLGLLPVASPPFTDDLDEAVDYLAERVAATLREVS